METINKTIIENMLDDINDIVELAKRKQVADFHSIENKAIVIRNYLKGMKPHFWKCKCGKEISGMNLKQVEYNINQHKIFCKKK